VVGKDGRVSWLELDGAANVRDLCGLPTREGGHTQPARLLRADNLQGLSARDVSVLVDGVGVTTVVDMRTPYEVDSEGPGPLTRVPSVAHVHQSVIPEGGRATDVAADALTARRERLAALYPEDPVCAYYLGYVLDRPDSMVGALRAIARAPGAAIVNCAAGKDRTGVVVALALDAVGVQRDAIVDDYVASGERIEAILDRLRASATYGADVDRMPAYTHKPQAATMVAFLGQVDERFAGTTGWLKMQGFVDADLDRLRAKLLD
jgi:protein tyrosine/serine phosphatase